jgi:uncharacterized protein (DUF342 family)
MLEKIQYALKQMEEAIKEGATIDPNDPRRASLLRTKIVKQADIASHTQLLNKIKMVVENAQGATINVLHDVHLGVVVGINDSVHNVVEDQSCVAFFERDGRIVMLSLKNEMA